MKPISTFTFALRNRLLATPAELDEFATKFAARGGLRVERDVMERVMIYGVFDRQGAMVAGYAFNVRPPFRYLDKLPAGVETPPLDECAEIGFLWMERRLPTLARFAVYARIILDFRRIGRPFLIAGSVHAGLVRQQREGFKATIYDGPVQVEDQRFHLRVYAGTTGAMIRALVANFAGRFTRRLGRRVRRVLGGGAPLRGAPALTAGESHA